MTHFDTKIYIAADRVQQVFENVVNFTKKNKSCCTVIFQNITQCLGKLLHIWTPKYDTCCV